jgi:hypothetical protein
VLWQWQSLPAAAAVKMYRGAVLEAMENRFQNDSSKLFAWRLEQLHVSLPLPSTEGAVTSKACKENDMRRERRKKYKELEMAAARIETTGSIVDPFPEGCEVDDSEISKFRCRMSIKPCPRTTRSSWTIHSNAIPCGGSCVDRAIGAVNHSSHTMRSPTVSSSTVLPTPRSGTGDVGENIALRGDVPFTGPAARPSLWEFFTEPLPAFAVPAFKHFQVFALATIILLLLVSLVLLSSAYQLNCEAMSGEIFDKIGTVSTWPASWLWMLPALLLSSVLAVTHPLQAAVLWSL